MDHHDKHTGQATKAEQVNSFIGEKFAGVILGVLPRDIDKPIISDGSITLVFECGWGIVLQDVKRENMWVESPEALTQATKSIIEHAIYISDVLLPAAMILDAIEVASGEFENPPDADITEGLKFANGAGGNPEKPKRKARRKVRKGNKGK